MLSQIFLHLQSGSFSRVRIVSFFSLFPLYSAQQLSQSSISVYLCWKTSLKCSTTIKIFALRAWIASHSICIPGPGREEDVKFLLSSQFRNIHPSMPSPHWRLLKLYQSFHLLNAVRLMQLWTMQGINSLIQRFQLRVSDTLAEHFGVRRWRFAGSPRSEYRPKTMSPLI